MLSFADAFGILNKRLFIYFRTCFAIDNFSLGTMVNCNNDSSSSSSFILKRPSFQAQLGLDVPSEMKPLHISLNTVHSACNPSSLISFFTHSSLYPHLSPLPPPHFYRPTPNHPHSYAPHARTLCILLFMRYDAPLAVKIGDNSLNFAQAHLTLALAASSTPPPAPSVSPK